MNSDDHMSEDRARVVVARAIELDAQLRQGVSIEDLRVISREIGLHPAAVERAIAEYRSEVPAAGMPLTWRMPVATTLYGAGLGAATGWLFIAGFSGGIAEWIVTGSFTTLLVSGIGIAASVDASEHAHFHRCNTGLWVGAASGIAVAVAAADALGVSVLGYPMNSLLAWAVTAWGTSSVVGSIALFIRSRRTAGDAGARPGVARVVGAGLRRLGSAIQRLADRIMEFTGVGGTEAKEAQLF